jgi:hypothetical protein
VTCRVEGDTYAAAFPLLGVRVMPELKNTKTAEAPANEQNKKPLPVGYRQGIITAITVLLGFSLGFLRFWALEAPGEWSSRSIIPAITLFIAIVFQIIALYRSLRLIDDEESEYRQTVLWFVASAVMLLVGVASAAWEIA